MFLNATALSKDINHENEPRPSSSANLDNINIISIQKGILENCFGTARIKTRIRMPHSDNGT